jgi:dethiobiotin synthetase
MTDRSLFVTGTDTGIGKTVVSAALVAGLDAYYWKPVQSGDREPTDTDRVRAWTGRPDARFLPEGYVLEAPVSPHASAALEGVEIDVDRLASTPLPDDRPVIVEGAGGLLVPLDGTRLIVDLVQLLAFPAVLVARSGLGTLNHTLLSLSELRRRALPVAGVIMIGDRHPSNRAAIEHYGDTRVLGEVPMLDVIDGASLARVFQELDLP